MNPNQSNSDRLNFESYEGCLNVIDECVSYIDPDANAARVELLAVYGADIDDAELFDKQVEVSWFLGEIMQRVIVAYSERSLAANVHLAATVPQIYRCIEQAMHRFESMKTRKNSSRNKYSMFVEYLRIGWLWNDGKFEQCPWSSQEGLPPLDDTSTWMKKIMPFLKEKFGNNPEKLDVFKSLLRTHGHSVSSDPRDRLQDDAPAQQWSQIRKKIHRAWTTMASRHDTATGEG